MEWKCSCGQKFASYLDRDSTRHVGHTMSYTGSTPEGLSEELASDDLEEQTCDLGPSDLGSFDAIEDPGVSLWPPEPEVPERPVEVPVWNQAVLVDTAEFDIVEQPAHYNLGDIECIDAIQSALGAEAFAGYCQGNAIKYLWRYRHKGKATEDLDKSAWYLKKLRTTLKE